MLASRSTRRVRLFRIAKNQAVRIPRAFELPGNEAILRRDDQGRLILEPMTSRPDILDLLATWTALGESDQMPSIEDLPA